MGADLSAHHSILTFRDWAADKARVPSDVEELALAHSILSKARAAYRRGDLFEKRRKLIDAWGAYCFGALPKNVLPLRNRKALR
jgi:hypothetical protein